MTGVVARFAGADGTAGSGRLIELVDTPEISILGSVDARQLDLNVGFYFFA